MRFALEYPETLSKLIIVDIAPKVYDSGYFLILLSHMLAAPAESMASRKTVDAWLREGLTKEQGLKNLEFVKNMM